MARKYISIFGIIIIIVFGNGCSEGNHVDLSIIPKPAEVSVHKGVYTIDSATRIVINTKNPILTNTADLLKDLIQAHTGIETAIIDLAGINSLKNSIVLSIAPIESMKPEAYVLEVKNQGLTLAAATSAGIFYGIQTLKQILPVKTSNSIPCLTIRDYPRYNWRGMMLDSCRHFMPLGFVKKFIDFLAMHKLNTFHWHLTEDQGWRIEIKKYPKLAETAAWRNETLVGHYYDRPQRYDSQRHGGFYTQKEIREVIAYAAERFITIVPEIEMPGHAGAALAAYPELSCTKGPFEVKTIWGVHEDVYCAGNEKTFEFLLDVLGEVIELFPSKYIHIGGDECPKARWKDCPDCQEAIKKNHLKDENELQSYFIKRIEKFLNSRGRKLIGWDEILEGGLAPDATVMSWRGTKGGIEAVKQGHDVVMAPTTHCYFDYYQGSFLTEPLAIGGFLPLKTVYSFDPSPPGFTISQEKHILGVQANLWTEYIPTPEHAEYMIFPRIAALAEVAWTKSEDKNWHNFCQRLPKMLNLYQIKGINYAKSCYNVSVLPEVDFTRNSVSIKLESELMNDNIRYTLNGSDPLPDSPLFENSLPLKETILLKTAVLKDQKQMGSVSRLKVIFHKAIARQPKMLSRPDPDGSLKNFRLLVDGIKGTDKPGDRNWFFWPKTDFFAEFDLGQVCDLKILSLGFLQNNRWAILFPATVEFYLSEDGTNFTLSGSVKNRVPSVQEGILRKDFKIEVTALRARFVRIKAVNNSMVMDSHSHKQRPASLAIDEIIVN